MSHIISKCSLLEDVDKNKAPIGVQRPLFAKYAAVGDEVIGLLGFLYLIACPFLIGQSKNGHAKPQIVSE